MPEGKDEYLVRMPGVPRSKACSKCKARKIKCDEKWPTCAPCARSRVECPGPPTGLKFVIHQNESRPGQRQRNNHRQQPNHDGPQELVPLSLQVRDVLPATSGTYASFRLVNPDPRPHPTTLGDRVARRLVAHLERGEDTGITLQMNYLKHLPQRLSQSPCLRDSVALFCSAWAGVRSRKPRGSIIDSTNYGRVLRSLQRALEGPEAFSVETLAAVTLLERTDNMFNRKPRENWALHQKGIINLLSQKGPPNLDDRLDVCIASENYGMLLSHFALEGKTENFMMDSPWKEVLEKCDEIYMNRNELQPYSVEAMKLLDRLYGHWPGWVAEKLRIRSNPYGDGMEEVARNLRAQLVAAQITVRDATVPILTEGLRSERIGEMDDPHGFVGKKYLFSNPALAQLFMSSIMLQLLLLLMVRQLDNHYDYRDETVIAEYRSVSTQAWMFETYLRSLEPVIAAKFLGGIILSFEAANDKEREYLAYFLAAIDESLDERFKDNAGIQKHIQEYAEVMTGERVLGGQKQE